ncbi:P-loop containing nucleoside triphosphate hydrolase protein [Chiua virens]|nr:P-loop containing nucleoside triphosphate hydrolase protein [Chiua virens]
MELYIAIVYGMLLTLLSVFGLDLGSTAQLTRHADMVFLGAFGVVAYHDLWPFFTYQEPAHQLDLYSAMEAALLGALGIVIPLTSYCEYRITDDTPLLKELHPEQTASLLSLLLYSWLDPLINIAYKSQHLAPDALFPLADYDHVEGLVTRNASYLESRGSRGSHVFFGLVKAFSSEYAMLVSIVLVKVVVSLASPFALEQFLRYLETQGKGATIQPIVWIALLFLGPTLYSILHQWSTFVLSRMAVRTEALLSDLVFKHALRIRLQGDENCNAPPDENDSSHKANLIGTINNHLTTDLTNVIAAKEFLPVVVGVPLQILLCIAFLYRILGWSALVGAAAMMCLVPVPGYVGSLFQSVEVEKMKITDARVQLVSETMNILRMIKLFGWERKINDKIQDRRAEELVLIRKRSLLQLLNNLVNFVIPLVIMLITYSVYTLVARRNLTGDIHRILIDASDGYLPDSTSHRLRFHTPLHPRFSKVALDRINTFLSNVFCELAAIDHSIPSPEDDNDATLDMIGISQATVSWTRRAKSRDWTNGFGEDVVAHGAFGRNALPPIWTFILPRHLGVAYVPQESWILNQTIRDNILFGSDFDQRRYTEVLFQCALETDVALLEHGDRTEVGERGVTLRFARITLARAIYSSAQVLLLDDVFAALDVQTSQWIVEHCFRGRLMMRRTIIMTTHHVSLFKDIPRYVVTLDKDGQAESHELLQASAGGDTDITDMGQDREVDVHGTPSTSDNTSTLRKYMSSTEEGKTLTTTEEIAEGHVGWPAVLLYLLGWGGAAPILNWGLFVFFLFTTYTSLAAQSWYLGYWAQQYQESPTVNVRYNIAIFSLIILNTLIVYILGYTLNLVGSLRASKVIHDRLVQRILGATFRYSSFTLESSRDALKTSERVRIDGMFAMSLSNLIGLTIRMITLLAVVVYMAPPFALFGLLTALVGGWCGQMYMKAELSVKREMSNAKAPLLAHLDAALAGLVSVRAFGAQSVFIKEYHSRIDQYTRIARTFYALNCWVSIRLEMLGALFLASLAAYLMYGYHNISPSNVGFSLNMAVDFSSAILWWITMFNETEIHGKASLTLERIASYMDVEQETERTSKTSPPAYWPASGDLRVENLSARYSSDAPNALHSLSFHIRSGERVGIVGRTGSGKTSLTLSLLRCLPAEGDVYYDGVLTSSIPLEALRSRVTIIPQSADLLNGTIRQNLDPFDQLDDAVLNDTLRSAGLSELQDLDTSGSDHDDGSNNTANRLTLDTPVTAGGANLSVGQRQIVALARAMVRESKLLILDEATSAIDHKTDAVIQRSLRELKGLTQLVIAHRLQSVMDADRIMVLDAGRIVELDSPSHLLQQEESIFRTLVYASKDRETLLSMVKRST